MKEYENATKTNMKIGQNLSISEIEKAVYRGLVIGNANIKIYNPTHYFSMNEHKELHDAIMHQIKQVL